MKYYMSPGRVEYPYEYIFHMVYYYFYTFEYYLNMNPHLEFVNQFLIIIKIISYVVDIVKTYPSDIDTTF